MSTMRFNMSDEIEAVKRERKRTFGREKKEEFVGVQWGTGFAVITAEAFSKLPQSKLRLLQPRRR